MLHTAMAYKGVVTAPHQLAAQAGAAVLREGGNAVEAMVAAAAAIAVVYPHMNAIGGDGFWMIAEPGRDPIGIEACGRAAAAARPAFYAGFADIPARGPQAALTVAGTVSGWAKALEVARPWGRPLPLRRLLEDAIDHARHGVPVTAGQEALTRSKLPELAPVPGFAEVFLPNGRVPARGERLRQPALAATLERLAEAGLDDFYRGDLARAMAADLRDVGSPIALRDLEAHAARVVPPLSVDLSGGASTTCRRRPRAWPPS